MDNIQADWSGKTILIGEDELVNYRLLEVILSKTKAKLIHGKNGVEVMELFKNNQDIDLVLIDIKMPLMDGYDVITEIRKENTLIPIIAQTAYALEEEKEKTFLAGCNDYISKPIRKNELMALIKAHLQ